MVKSIVFAGLLLFLSACSSQNLSFEDLQQAYPDTFAAPVQSLSEDTIDKVALPSTIPFEVTNVQAETEEKEVTVSYQSATDNKAKITTLTEPGNILKESELQVPLNSGAVAGVQEKKDYVFIEWYESDKDVIYQIEYYATKEERAEEAIEIAESI